MDKIKVFAIFGIILMLALLFGAYIIDKQLKDSEQEINSVQSNPVNITYENLNSELAKTKIVRDIPKDTAIGLKFYNFDSGVREIEKSYIIRDGKISESEEKSDLTLSIHSKYLNGLTNNNFCAVIQKANKNGDVLIETELSKTDMAWKFKSLYKHKSCLGL